MAIQSAECRIATELRQKAQQYRGLARSLVNEYAANLAFEMGSACDARAEQIERKLIAHAA